jgi:hypothetical protein
VNAEITQFLGQLRANQDMAVAADRLDEFVRALESEATMGNVLFLDAMTVVLSQSGRTLAERVDLVRRLCLSPDGPGHA